MKNLAINNTEKVTINPDGIGYINFNHLAILLGITVDKLNKYITDTHPGIFFKYGLDEVRIHQVSIYFAYTHATNSQQSREFVNSYAVKGIRGFIYEMGGCG